MASTSPVSAGPSPKNSVIDEYVLGDCIGRGAFGSVHRALNTRTGETVAIKQVKLTNIPKSELNLIMMEIDLLKELKHPNIVKYKGFVKTKDFLNIVMELCENGSLASISKKFGRFPEHLVAVFLAQVLDGLHYLHEQGVIHRDIKGANILTTKNGLVKLADFGVATKLADMTHHAVVGSPYWMAPEVIELLGATTASDIWSVGCTAIELIQGQPPHHNLAPMSALFRIVQDEHPPLPERISAALRDFLLQCFQKDCNLRVSAKKLLRHPWILQARKKVAPSPYQYSEAVNTVRQWNETVQATPCFPPIAASSTFAQKAAYQQITMKQNPMSRKSSAEDSRTLSLGVPEQDEVRWDDDFEENIPQVLPQPKTRHQTNLPPLPLLPGRLPNFVTQDAHAPLVITSIELESDVWDDDFDVATANFSILKKLDIDLCAKPPLSKNKPQSINEIASPSRGKFADDHTVILPTSRMSPPLARVSSTSCVTSRTNSNNTKPDSILDKYTEEHTDDYSDVLKPDHDTLAVHESRLKWSVIDDDWPDSGGSDDEYEDPFLTLVEDESENIGRDAYTRASATVMELIAQLRPNESEEVLIMTCDQLVAIFKSNPEMRKNLITHHAVMPIVEMLEGCDKNGVLLSILRVINQSIENNTELQESLCLLGALPVVMSFTSAVHDTEIRTEAAHFVQHMCRTSTLTLQMFISCRGLPVLVNFLDEDYMKHRELTWMTIDGIWCVFELQGPTPKNDFCLLFAKHGLLMRLAKTLKDLRTDKHPLAAEYTSRVIQIFLIFSQADPVIKEVMAERSTIRVLVQQLRLLSPMLMVSLLKIIKNISMHAPTLEMLQKAHVIEELCQILERKDGPCSTEICNQVLNTLFNLCRINKTRQEAAAVAGVVPHLQHFIRINSPLKQFALPILCEMAHAGALSRKILWKHDVIQTYTTLLRDAYWQVNALDAILAWMSEETAAVEPMLILPVNVDAICGAFCLAKTNSFENMLDPLQNLLVKSKVLAQALTIPTFINRLVDKLQNPKALVRIILLKILTLLCDAEDSSENDDKQSILDRFSIRPVIERLGREDAAILVVEMTRKLV
ncbi:hypothetical protein SeMB42_g05652 [Synchytrium endobioticum]|uniref:non-specific serine/threonine protein kinase n=1 Tax=Synchytrium endobioticum TaxID=286115 RepID=A0A507CQ40_9FUNG|nr:hypothetical protein SeMB42_g05652 [Synchytrium endobioticum]TPX44740.1 hypothetical protein SeLEV6574_g04320 [Synchytrium endobioticum]